MNRATVVMLALQAAGPLLTLAFGVLALRVAARGGPGAAAWRLTGLAFAVDGVHSTLQAAAAVWAVAAGPGSVVYEAFVRTLPAGNSARSLLVLGYAVALLVLASRGEAAFPRHRVLPGLLAMLAGGTALGMLEGEFAPERHFPVLAWLGVCTLLALFAALYRSLPGSALDFLLWGAVALYAVREALTANIVSMLAFMDLPVWTPSPYALLSVSIFFLLLMVACAARRLAMARAGVRPPALLPRLRPHG